MNLIEPSDLELEFCSNLRALCIERISELGTEEAAKQLGLLERGGRSLVWDKNWDLETAYRAAHCLQLPIIGDLCARLRDEKDPATYYHELRTQRVLNEIEKTTPKLLKVNYISDVPPGYTGQVQLANGLEYWYTQGVRGPLDRPTEESFLQLGSPATFAKADNTILEGAMAALEKLENTPFSVIRLAEMVLHIVAEKVSPEALTVDTPDFPDIVIISILKNNLKCQVDIAESSIAVRGSYTSLGWLMLDELCDHELYEKLGSIFLS